MERALKKTRIYLLFLVSLLLASLLTAVPVWLLWNELIPEIFGLKPIDFWQAFGLILLLGALFRGVLTVEMKDSSK